MVQNFNIDKISLEILAMLQENSRISFTEIGKKVQLSSSSVTERIKRLEQLGIIDKYTIKINHEALNLKIEAIMLLSISGVFGFQEKVFVKEISKYPEVVECLRITGKDDFMVKVAVNSIHDLKQINDEVAKFGQVTTSVIVSDFLNFKSINIRKLKNEAFY